MFRGIHLVPPGTKIDFFGHRFYAFFASFVVIFGSLTLILTQGLNFGVDFTGGTLLEIQVEKAVSLKDLREDLNSLKFGEVSIQEFGSPNNLLVRIPAGEGGDDAQRQILTAIKDRLGQHFGTIDYRRIEFVGPQVGDELKIQGGWAILFTVIAVAAYIWFRFEWQYGVASVAALIHDVVGVVGLFSLTQMQFDLSTVAAVLLVAGYSINDTVIIFDRIRENLRKYKKMKMDDLINLSINDTLARTLMTSGTTIAALFALWLFGGDVIRGFVSALFFGIVIGTHSSYYVASPILYYLNLRETTDKKAASAEDGATGQEG